MDDQTAEQQRHRVRTAMLASSGSLWARIGLMALTLWVGLGSSSLGILDALVPPQRWVYEALMPDHQTASFGLQRQGAQISLAVRSQTARYIVVRGKAYPPGVDFEASTPARSALLIPMMVLLGGLLVICGTPSSIFVRGICGVGAAAVLVVVTPAAVLAGAQWGTVYAGLEELSRPALLVAASDFILHGGGLALAGAVVWALRGKSMRTSEPPSRDGMPAAVTEPK